jgi:predicted GH43/DUF377 family glycosyl hydrolase
MSRSSNIPSAEGSYCTLGNLEVRRLPVALESDDSKVITRRFLPDANRIKGLFSRIEQMSDVLVQEVLATVESDYGHRHKNLEKTFENNWQEGCNQAGIGANWSPARRLLGGAYLTMEYAVESAALFNPSIVPHPDQSGVAPGSRRFLMSLRATGEGHISSVVFRTGIIDAGNNIKLDPPSEQHRRTHIDPDRQYLKPTFCRKLGEMGVHSWIVDTLMERLGETFGLDELEAAAANADEQVVGHAEFKADLETIVWLARSNYEIKLDKEAPISELVVFPMSEADARGIEDLRLVQFVDDDGSVEYYGTYTAYNGMHTLPMMVSTESFHNLHFSSLNGACSANKGMALFPRKIDGHYVMCARIDGEHLYIMYSDYVHFWETAERIDFPRSPWEMYQLGNCGSPIETPEGWLLLTHGVGPVRTYSIGAILLDLENPRKVIGRLRQPLIMSSGDEREGYVPNVVYTCGAMINNGELIIPYAVADTSVRMAAVDIQHLVTRLLAGGPDL